MECVKNVSVSIDTSGCLKACSGFIITSLWESEEKEKWETFLTTLDEYNNYKKVTPYPEGQIGK